MTFRYFAISKPKERDRPRGLFAVNRDRQAGRLDTLSYDHLEGRWVFDPGITRYLFKEDYIEDATEISREQAQQVARELGIPLPSEDEMMAEIHTGRRIGDFRKLWETTCAAVGLSGRIVRVASPPRSPMSALAGGAGATTAFALPRAPVYNP